MKTQPEIWHTKLAYVVGQLSITCERRKISNAKVQEWRAVLDAIEKDMADYSYQRLQSANPPRAKPEQPARPPARPARRKRFPFGQGKLL